MKSCPTLGWSYLLAPMLLFFCENKTKSSPITKYYILGYPGVTHSVPTAFMNAVGTEWITPGLQNAVGTEWIMPGLWNAVVPTGSRLGYGMQWVRNGSRLGYEDVSTINTH